MTDIDAALRQATEDSWRLGLGAGIALAQELAAHPWLDDGQRAVLAHLVEAMRAVSAEFTLGVPDGR